MARPFFRQLPRQEMATIERIAYRAARMYEKDGWPREQQEIELDVWCVHSTVPLRLDELECADDFNFAHDIYGIARHLNRETGEIEHHFHPRFARPTTRTA